MTSQSSGVPVTPSSSQPSPETCFDDIETEHTSPRRRGRAPPVAGHAPSASSRRLPLALVGSTSSSSASCGRRASNDADSDDDDAIDT